MDFLDYYSCMWDTLTVIEPISGMALRFNNSELCSQFPRWQDRDCFLRGRLLMAVGASGKD